MIRFLKPKDYEDFWEGVEYIKNVTLWVARHQPDPNMHDTDRQFADHHSGVTRRLAPDRCVKRAAICFTFDKDTQWCVKPDKAGALSIFRPMDTGIPTTATNPYYSPGHGHRKQRKNVGR